MQLIPGLSYAVAVVAVHHEDQALRVLEVVPPQGPDLRAPGERVSPPSSLPVILRESCSNTGLTLSWPPTSHTVKLMFLYSTVSTLKPARTRTPVRACSKPKRAPRFPSADRGVRTDSGDGRHNLAQLQLIQDCGLARRVKTDLLPMAHFAWQSGVRMDSSKALSLAASPGSLPDAGKLGITACPEAHHQDPHLLLAEEPRKQLGKCEPHLGCGWLPAETSLPSAWRAKSKPSCSNWCRAL